MEEQTSHATAAAVPAALSDEAMAKREARRRKRKEEEEGVQGTDKLQEEDEENMWENEYEFSSFSLKVMEEFGGDACVGGTQWPGNIMTRGVRVARYLDNPLVFPPGALEGKTVLDVGSGCGLVAAVAAKHGAKVLAVEKDIVLPLLQENLEANGVLQNDNDPVPFSSSLPAPLVLQEGKVAVAALYWGPEATQPLAPFDVVIAAACLYMPKTVPLLLQTLWNVSDEQSLVVLCCILGQNTLEAFLAEVPNYFAHTAMDDNGAVVGTSDAKDLLPVDVATRILVLRRNKTAPHMS